MYGIVNRAIEELIVEKFGAEKWEEVKDKAGFKSEGFMTLKPYADELTFQLVAAASEILNIPAQACAGELTSVSFWSARCSPSS